MKTELKNCLSLYKIFYSCAFILILCVIHPIIYYEEIGSAIQSPIAFLTIIFCSDTYLMEVKSKRADVFHLYDQKKQLKVISQRVGVQILYLLILSCVGYVLFFWQKPGSVNEGISGIQIFLLYFIAMFGTIWLWSICSVILCTLLPKYVGRYWMFIWNCHWTYIKSGKFIFRKSGIVFFQLL
ncbi:hypothetical protein M5E86_11160 [Blautia wexlerae]|nr:hypothetical protein M5E86_11160 [Blautia wexlerae]